MVLRWIDRIVISAVIGVTFGMITAEFGVRMLGLEEAAHVLMAVSVAFWFLAAYLPLTFRSSGARARLSEHILQCLRTVWSLPWRAVAERKLMLAWLLLSVVLLMSAGWLWRLSDRVCHVLRFPIGARIVVSAESERYGLVLIAWTPEPGVDVNAERRRWGLTYGYSTQRAGISVGPGFEIEWNVRGFAPIRYSAAHIPYRKLVIALALLAVYPACRLTHHVVTRYRKRPHGLCLSCGYDLTGNISGVCPECGQPVTRSEEARTEGHGSGENV